MTGGTYAGVVHADDPAYSGLDGETRALTHDSPTEFSQPWTPVLSAPGSQLVVDDLGIGLPVIQVPSTGHPYADTLRGPGLRSLLDGDVAHENWHRHPRNRFPAAPTTGAPRLRHRQFAETAITAEYGFAGRRFDTTVLVAGDTAVSEVTISAPLDLPLTLHGYPIGRATVDVLDNGVHLDEVDTERVGLASRASVAAFGEDGCELPVAVSRVVETAWTEATDDGYDVQLPVGTVRFRVVVSVSRVAFVEPEALRRQGTRLVDPVGTIEAWRSRARKRWMVRAKDLPRFAFRDGALTAALQYAVVNQAQCELPQMGGALPYPAMMAKQTFTGFWAWDFAFQAIAARWHVGHELATGSLRTLRLAQVPDGCIVNNASHHGVTSWLEEHGSGRRFVALGRSAVDALDTLTGTHPPMVGQAIRAVWDATGDQDFARDLVRVAVPYTDWFITTRASERSPDLIVARKWSDTGQDNSTRWGSEVLTGFGNVHNPWWAFPIAPVDLNVMWALHLRDLSDVVRELGDDTLASRYSERSARVLDAVERELWSDAEEFYLDRDESTGQHIPVRSPAGFYPLLGGRPTRERFGRLSSQLIDPKRFWPEFPLPTLAADDPDFQPENSYWTGPIWANHLYHVFSGVSGYDRGLANRLIDDWVRLLTHSGYATSFENYNPVTGQGQNASNFLWNGLLVDAVLTEMLGLRMAAGGLSIDREAIRPEWTTWSIRNLGVGGTSLDVSRDGGSLAVTNVGHQMVRIADGRHIRDLEPGGRLALTL